jgi:hypothetical protein
LASILVRKSWLAFASSCCIICCTSVFIEWCCN